MLHKQAASSRGELKMYEYGMPVLHSLMYTFELHVLSTVDTAAVVTLRFPGPPVCLRPPGSSGSSGLLGFPRSPWDCVTTRANIEVSMFILKIDMLSKVNSPDPLNGRGL